MEPLHSQHFFNSSHKSTILSGSRVLYKRDTTGNKMARLENGLNIGDRAIGLGLNIKGMNILLAALKNIEIIQF